MALPNERLQQALARAQAILLKVASKSAKKMASKEAAKLDPYNMCSAVVHPSHVESS